VWQRALAIEIIGIFKMGSFRQNESCGEQANIYNLRKNCRLVTSPAMTIEITAVCAARKTIDRRWPGPHWRGGRRQSNR
jgi:hypothetical protein